MNNTFDWNRFCEVVKKDFRNLWPLYGRTMLILALLPVTIWLLRMVFPVGLPIPPEIRVIMIMLVSVLAGCTTASRLYRTWNLPGDGIYFAMLPASKLEKFLSASFYSVVVCPLLVLLCSVLVDILFTLLPFGGYHAWLWNADGIIAENDYTIMINLIFFFNLLALIPLYMYLSTWFKKHKALRTTLWLFLFYMVSILFRLRLFNSSSVVSWLEDTVDNVGQECVVNILLDIQLALPVIGFFLFGWLAWRRLDRMGY